MPLVALLKGYKEKFFPTDEPFAKKGHTTFFGVYLPSVLSIFGVIIYLRLGEIVGSAGVIKTVVIILLASLITFITGLSISATSTNTPVKSGGAYYMLSRSYGIELGAAIGVSLYLAQILGMAFYIEGFAEAFLSLFPHFNPLAVKATTLTLLAATTLISSSFALRSQLFIFLVIALSLVSIFTGDPKPAFQSMGEGGAGGEPLPFWVAFAIFFPAVTGIEAGFSMSGDLKNPSRSLPIGTLAAVLTGLSVYLALALFMWFRVPQSLLETEPLILSRIARFPILVILGIFAATLSSALTSFLAGPRTLQALAYDGVVPKIFAKGTGEAHEPRAAAAFSLVLIYIVLLFGSINAIAPILTMFFLISYGMLNFSSGLETRLGNPSWRPTIPIPASISFLGGFLSVFAMFMINPGTTFAALLLIILFYFFVKKKGVGKNLDDIRTGLLTYYVKKAIYHLSTTTPRARSWQPNCLVFASHAFQRGHLTEFADAVTKRTGFLTTVSILTSTSASHDKILSLKTATQEFYRKQKILSLVEVVKDHDFYSGMERVIATYGMGSISPNTVIMGAVPTPNLGEKFANLIRLCADLRKNVVIVKEGTKKYPFPSDAGAHAIDVWWDPKNRKNSYLMTLLAHMLHAAPGWRAHPVVIKCLAPNASAKGHIGQHLEQFLSKSRLNIEVKIFTATPDQNSLGALIRHHSALAKFVFVGLDAPKIGQPFEEYLAAYAALAAPTDAFPPNTAFVLNSERLDLDQIFR